MFYLNNILGRSFVTLQKPHLTFNNIFIRLYINFKEICNQAVYYFYFDVKID